MHCCLRMLWAFLIFIFYCALLCLRMLWGVFLKIVLALFLCGLLVLTLFFSLEFLFFITDSLTIVHGTIPLPELHHPHLCMLLSSKKQLQTCLKIPKGVIRFWADKTMAKGKWQTIFESWEIQVAHVTTPFVCRDI